MDPGADAEGNFATEATLMMRSEALGSSPSKEREESAIVDLVDGWHFIHAA